MNTYCSHPYLALAAGCNLVALEASFLSSNMEDDKQALGVIKQRQQQAQEAGDPEAVKFWQEAEHYIKEGTPSDHRGTTDLIALISLVDNFTPREKWIIPILENTFCRDFKTQLLAAVEDYEIITQE